MIYYHSKAVASATLLGLKKTDGRYVGNSRMRVAEIPDDGGEPEEK